MIEEEALPEQTSWKMLMAMALASVVFAAGSVVFLTQDFGTSNTTVETTNEPDPDPTVAPTATSEPDQDDDIDSDNSDTDDDDTDEDSDSEVAGDERIRFPEKGDSDPDCTAKIVDGACVDLGDLFEGIELPTPVATAIPVLPQLLPRPLITTVPTRPTRVPSPNPAPAPPPAPAPAPAPAPPPPPAPPQVVYVQPAPAPPPPPVYAPAPPPPVYVPAPAPVYAPAPQPQAVNPGACTQIVVSFDMNGDGASDGTLPSPCSPCPSGALPAHHNGDSMLDC